eukprot:PITA_27305
MTDNYVKRCFYCGKPGHQIKECYKRQADERKGKQRKHQGCFSGEEDDHNHDLRLFTVDCALSASKGDEDNIWYVDSGASSHMIGKKDCFEFLEESACGSKIYLGDDSGYEIKGCGDIPVKLPSGDIKHLKNVLYALGIKKNLIFVSMITEQDMQVQFFKNGCVIQDSQLETVATGVRMGNLYRLDARSMPRQPMVAATSTAENLWHQRFRHLNLQDLILLKKKENQTGKKIKILRPGSRGKNIVSEFMNFCKQHGIIQQFTVPHTPTNRMSSITKNKDPLECARSMLQDRKKLDPKALKCIFVGYGTEYKAYKLYNPVTHKVFTSRDVIFHEQTEDGKEDSNNDSHIPFLIELNSEEEEKQGQEQEKKQEEVAADSVISDDAGPESAETDRVEINADWSVEKFKARLVAKGYSQQEGIDFDDTFAPIAKLNTIRILICLATKHKWKLHQLDVKSAFLNGELEEEIYLVQPPGFVKKGQEHLVCKLHKALYGLKQAPRSWYGKTDSFFIQHSFHRSLNDPNLYTKINKQRQIILISLYVDDMIITGNANNLIKEIKQQMSQVFEMKDLGDLHHCLGLEVWKDSGQTFLTQGKYAKTLLERFRMEQCKTAATPLQQNLKLSSDNGTKQGDATLYRQLVGSLIYLTTTRPDLAYSVSVLSSLCPDHLTVTGMQQNVC